ncbi:hypothetical protein ACWC4A_08755 [Streptomyces mirabilis]
MSNTTLPSAFINRLKGTLTAITVIGFLILVGYAFWETFQAETTKPNLNPAYTYVSSGISSLIGGYYAQVFTDKSPNEATDESLLFSNAKALTDSTTTTNSSGSRTYIFLAEFAIAAYAFVGVASIVVWISKPDLVADPIKGTATTFTGLAFPMVRGYINQSR